MHNKQDMKPLRDLNLTSRFLFDEVMEDREAHRDALSIIFGREIPLLDYSKTEQELRVSPLLRSIRMDVISMDEDLVVYNSEMQAQQKTDLAKRSRYYQALLDTNLLEPGIANYNLLNPSYIILITPFDLFGYKKYQYTFEPRCIEVPELRLEDGATRIFLNTKGENDADVSDELIEFLHYLEDTSDQRADETKSERIKRIHERVRKVKLSEKVGVKYMQAWEEKYYEREEGRAEGLAEGLAEGRTEGRTINLINLIQKKIRKGKSLDETADELEEEVTEISKLYELVKANLEKDPEDILELLNE
jgi:predicted transposase/invertase (TIGR01784 family)